MAIITIFSGSFCNEESIIHEVISQTGYRLITDQEVVAEASRLAGMDASKVTRAFSARTSVFNKFTHEKEHSIAFLRLAVAKIIPDDNVVVTCFCGQLIPKTIDHTLRVCLIAGVKYRIDAAIRDQGVSRKEAAKLVQRREEDCAAWLHKLFNYADPWDAVHYDIVIPADKMIPAEAALVIAENAAKDVVRPTADSQQALQDFRLGSRTEAALAREGHDVEVTAHNGAITLTINKHVLMLSRLQEELRTIVQKVPGVTSVETKVGKDFHQSDIYRKYDFQMPSRVLLVDDEREFVQTLSERLLMRDMGSAIAYDGASALKLIQEDEPDVIILDLKMPGVDGLDVLRKVKETRPEIEVIMVTGHGNEEDRERCMQLGAFAYLQKPLDISVLSETIRKANENVRRKKEPKD